MTCRNAKDDVKTGGASSFRDQLGGGPEVCPSGIRRIGGAKPDQALVWNVRTCRSDAKGAVDVLDEIGKVELLPGLRRDPSMDCWTPDHPRHWAIRQRLSRPLRASRPCGY